VADSVCKSMIKEEENEDKENKFAIIITLMDYYCCY